MSIFLNHSWPDDSNITTALMSKYQPCMLISLGHTYMLLRVHDVRLQSE